MIAVSALVAAVTAGVWVAVAGGEFVPRLGLSLLVLAGLLSLAGGTMLSRASTMDTQAFLGLGGPGMEEPGEGETLTAIGVFLFVGVPLFAAGALLYGAG